MTNDICSQNDCNRPRRSRGLCAFHYQQAWRTGSLSPGKRLRTPDEKFLSGFAYGDTNECWPWTGVKSEKGYGVACCVDGQKLMAHRYSYRYHNGDIPDGMLVRHTCDNPPCVNPSHLLIGTAQDNVNDKFERGRFVKRTLLTNEDVLEIRKLFSLGMNQTQIGLKFGVTQSCVSNVCRRKSFSDVA